MNTLYCDLYDLIYSADLTERLRACDTLHRETQTAAQSVDALLKAYVEINTWGGYARPDPIISRLTAANPVLAAQEKAEREQQRDLIRRARSAVHDLYGLAAGFELIQSTQRQGSRP